MNVLDTANLNLTNNRYNVTSLAYSAKASAGTYPVGGASSSKVDKSSDLYKAAEDFQSIFIKTMLDTMRKTVHKESETEQSQGEQVFEDMLYDEYSKKMSKTAGFDLADNLYKQMAFLQNLPKTVS
jgi:flagellar protein FlgJ